MSEIVERVARAIEVRRNPDGTLDEIVADGAYIHLEQMAPGCWWMRIEKDGDAQVVFLNSRGKITANSYHD